MKRRVVQYHLVWAFCACVKEIIKRRALNGQAKSISLLLTIGYLIALLIHCRPGHAQGAIPEEQKQYEEQVIAVQQQGRELEKIDNPFRRQTATEAYINKRRFVKPPPILVKWICRIQRIGIDVTRYGDQSNSQEEIGFRPNGSEYGMGCASRASYVLVYRPTADNREWLASLTVGQAIEFSGKPFGPTFSLGAIAVVLVHRQNEEFWDAPACLNRFGQPCGR